MIKIYLSRVMKTIMCLMLTGLMTVSAATFSQQITLKAQNMRFESVIDAIRKQSGYTVFGTKKLLDAARPVSVNVRSMPLVEFLNEITKSQSIRFAIEDKTISFFGAAEAKVNSADTRSAVTPQDQPVTGVVHDAETNAVLSNVTVALKGTNIRTQTDDKGAFRLVLPESDKRQILVFTYVGMKTQEVVYRNQEKLDILLQPTDSAIEEVVVTGIFQRDNNAFAGSARKILGADLRMVGNQNILQSLKTLDPSFAIIDNNQFGSDPNRFPDIEIRGKSSVIGLTDEFGANPNQPLFILDGFESTLAIISDLSMDRVESITLLKDAAATAIYGSKAANGVVVVETKRPQPGQLRINYAVNGAVGLADLTDYNLMNAEEKLQFEFLSGRYGAVNADGNFTISPGNEVSQLNYYDRLKEVRRGVNTYWPNEPLRTALTQRHTLFAEGGDKNMRYSTSFNYGITQGVMQGSDRQATNGNVKLLYRKGTISVNNSLSIDYIKANHETVEFSEFSRASPYHRKYDEFGNPKKVLESYTYFDATFTPVTRIIYSPFVNQNNLNINQEQSRGFTNNLEIEWRMLESLRARARFGIRSLNNGTEYFRSPFNNEFATVDVFQRGVYNQTNGKETNYDGDFMLTYGKLLGGKHMLNAVLGGRMEQLTRGSAGFGVSGYLDDEFSNPNFALGYTAEQRATYQESKRRGGSTYMNMGYAYDQRFLMDATIRSDGSSIFGNLRQFSTIWSVGLGWNIHNEQFLKDKEWINQLKLRGSVGNPGNQNFNDYISMRIYRYNNENRNPFGASTIISNMGNSNLKWQTTLDRNIGVDFVTFNSRLRINADYFVKNTDPLLVFVALPSSTGISRQAQNLGEQITTGFTIISDYTLIKKEQFNWRVNLNMRQLKGEYAKMGDQLSNFNDANKSRNLIRYYDGGSPSDLWAVRSLGIDPATGREVFLNKNDQQTFVHNYQDEVVVGNSDPDLEGVIGSSFYYKGFSAAINLRYKLGGQAFMQTLYDKVENITSDGVMLNQDKRALYDRWKKPGDVARFKSISINEYTPISSRFVQDNNVVIGESFSIGYENSTSSWLHAIRASSVTFRAYMNDIFHFSNIKNERGIDYPFARSVSFSAAVRF